MTSPKAVLGSVLGRFLFREAALLRAELLTPRFRRLVLGGRALRDVAWSPGDKVQIFLPSIGMRTYTPTRWDGAVGETELIAYLHGDTPGSRWARDLAVDERAQLFGPRGSLRARGAIVVGDETSVGLALANGIAEQTILEVSDEQESRAALERLGLASATLVPRASDGAHHPTLVEAVATIVERAPHAPLLLSGRADAIQAVRRGLKARGVQAPTVSAKAYWTKGKVGLD